MTTATIQIRQKGVITIPHKVRRSYGLETGDVLDFSDLGGGIFLLNARTSEVASLGDKVAETLAAEDVTIDEMFEALDRERKAYYQEHYA